MVLWIRFRMTGLANPYGRAAWRERSPPSRRRRRVDDLVRTVLRHSQPTNLPLPPARVRRTAGRVRRFRGRPVSVRRRRCARPRLTCRAPRAIPEVEVEKLGQLLGLRRGHLVAAARRLDRWAPLLLRLSSSPEITGSSLVVGGGRLLGLGVDLFLQLLVPLLLATLSARSRRDSHTWPSCRRSRCRHRLCSSRICCAPPPPRRFLRARRPTPTRARRRRVSCRASSGSMRARCDRRVKPLRSAPRW